MEPIGKVIRLHLVNGDPQDFVIGEIMGWSGIVMSFPRALFASLVKSRRELETSGVYFLVGSDSDSSQTVYIGKTDNLTTRLGQHDQKKVKNFDRVAFYHSKDQNISSGHVGYLENRVIRLVKKIGKATVSNDNNGSEVKLSDADSCYMENELQHLIVLMSAMGFDFLKEEFSKPPVLDASRNIEVTKFRLTRQNSHLVAEAYESEGKFIVLKGSKARHPAEAGPSASKAYHSRVNSLQCDGKLSVLEEDPRLLVFTQDVSFTSPSLAGETICASRVNGREEWRVADTNQTYNEWDEQRMAEAERQNQLCQDEQ